MVYIIGINTEKLDLNEVEAAAADFLTEERKEKVARLMQEQDKINAILAELLLLYSLKSFWNFKEEAVVYGYGPNGKPYLKDQSCFFNISHSHQYVLCATGKQELGIDIEQHTDSHLKLIKLFHPKEQMMYQQLPEVERKKAFFDLWSLRESYVKYLGIGLSLDLTKYYFQLEKNAIQVYQKEATSNHFQKISDVNFGLLTIDPQYSAAYCTAERQEPEVKLLNFDQIIKQLESS